MRLYAQIENRGQDEPLIARIRDRYTVYAWSAFFCEADARKWIESTYVQTLIERLERQAKGGAE